MQIETELKVALRQVEKYEALEAEDKEVIAAMPELRKELAVRIKATEDIPTEVLMVNPDHDDKSELAQRIRAVTHLRTRIELLPGVRVRIASKLNDLEEKITQELIRLKKLAIAEARVRLEEFTTARRAELVKHCGGDPVRVKAALDPLVSNSECRKWVDAFNVTHHVAHPPQAVRVFIALYEHFERGDTFNAGYAASSAQARPQATAR